MRGDYRDNAACSQNEAFSACLLESVRRFFLDFGSVLIHKRVLPDAAAHDAAEKLLGFCQGRKGFSVMPVHDLEI